MDLILGRFADAEIATLSDDELSTLERLIEVPDPDLYAALTGDAPLPPAHGFRYLRIQIALHGSPHDCIATIGHELRHAIEVADASTVVDQEGLAALYPDRPQSAA